MAGHHYFSLSQQTGLAFVPQDGFQLSVSLDDPVGIADETGRGIILFSKTLRVENFLNQPAIDFSAMGIGIAQGEVGGGRREEWVFPPEGVEMIGGPSVVFGMVGHFGPIAVQVLVDHDGQEVPVGLDAGGLEAVHNDLSFAFELFVDRSGEEGVDELEEGGEFFFGACYFAGQMDVIVHEFVGVERDIETIFVFKEEVVIEALGPFGFQEPGLVMALPGDVEDSAVPEDGISWEVGHAT